MHFDIQVNLLILGTNPSILLFTILMIWHFSETKSDRNSINGCRRNSFLSASLKLCSVNHRALHNNIIKWGYFVYCFDESALSPPSPTRINGNRAYPHMLKENHRRKLIKGNTFWYFLNRFSQFIYFISLRNSHLLSHYHPVVVTQILKKNLSHTSKMKTNFYVLYLLSPFYYYLRNINPIDLSLNLPSS